MLVLLSVDICLNEYRGIESLSVAHRYDAAIRKARKKPALATSHRVLFCCVFLNRNLVFICATHCVTVFGMILYL